MRTIPQERLKELFDYREDGNLIWIDSPNSKVPAGSVAGKTHKNGYKWVGYQNKHYGLHRLIYAWHTGEWPKTVDHKSRDHSDNRIENLRPLANPQNHINSDKTWSASGYKGVTKAHSCSRWIAHIGVKGRTVRLGRFATPEEAHACYVAAREEYYPGAYAEI